MAMNWQTFRTRSLTAICFVAVMLAGLLWNQWSFLVLFTIIHFGCWWEFLRLVEKIHHTYFHIYTKLGLMLAGYGLFLWCCGPAYQAGGYVFSNNFSLPVSGAGFLLMLLGIFQKYPVKPGAFGMAMLGLLYISLSWGLLMQLPDIPFADPGMKQQSRIYALFFPLLLIITMWINDTMAYIVGSLIGKTPLSKISPKKTWEGTVGGILLAGAITGYIAASFDKSSVLGKGMIEWMGFVTIIAVAGTVGDLLESKLKRMAGVKDSGSIMPGHGGFLDRFDSLLLAIPVAWLYIQLFF